MNSKFAFVIGLLLGGLGIYAWLSSKMLSLQQALKEKSQPPRKVRMQDWWENHKPQTEDDYQLTLARRDWLRYFFSTFVYPYVDRSTSGVIIQEFIMPIEREQIDQELQREDQDRLLELMHIQCAAAGYTDD